MKTTGVVIAGKLCYTIITQQPEVGIKSCPAITQGNYHVTSYRQGKLIPFILGWSTPGIQVISGCFNCFKWQIRNLDSGGTEFTRRWIELLPLYSEIVVTTGDSPYRFHTEQIGPRLKQAHHVRGISIDAAAVVVGEKDGRTVIGQQVDVGVKCGPLAEGDGYQAFFQYIKTVPLIR